MIDVSARGEGRSTWREGSWLGNSFDRFCPIGPAISDRRRDRRSERPHAQLWDDGQLRHNCVTDDVEHGVREIIEFASTITTLNSGDVIGCGTNQERAWSGPRR